jgi:hypothetical protein
MTPAGIVGKAVELGLSAIAVTDHDTVDGVEEALEAGEKAGIPVVPGVEIGVDHESRELHILGYFPESSYSGIRGYFGWILKKRDERNTILVANLNRAGFDVSIEEMYEKAAGGTPGRPHLAACLVEKGYAGDIGEAFDNILLRDDIFVPREKTGPENAVAEILENNGIPVFAHPVYEDRGGMFEKTAAALVEMGVKGIEVFHTDHEAEDTAKYLEYAKRNNLVITGGSDFHGANKEDAALGRPPVDDIYHRLLLERL